MHIELARTDAPLLPLKWVVVADDEMLFGPDTLQRCRDFVVATRSRQEASSTAPGPLSLACKVPNNNGGSWHPGSGPRDPESIRRRHPRSAIGKSSLPESWFLS
ncbi:hypothetical protein BH11PSE3_BH11PSE3_41170 [soil metagenome]